MWAWLGSRIQCALLPFSQATLHDTFLYSQHPLTLYRSGDYGDEAEYGEEAEEESKEAADGFEPQESEAERKQRELIET